MEKMLLLCMKKKSIYRFHLDVVNINESCAEVHHHPPIHGHTIFLPPLLRTHTMQYYSSFTFICPEINGKSTTEIDEGIQK